MKLGQENVIRQRRTQAERTAISDGRMFETAMQLIRERGTGNMTLKDIGELSGYSRGLASSRYGSKEQFLYELVGEIHDRWDSEFRAIRGRRRGLDALNVNFSSTIHFLTRDPDYIRSMYLLYYEMIGSNELIRKRLSEYHDGHLRALARWLNEGIEDGDIRPDIDVQALAVEYLSFYYGIIYLWLIRPETVDLEKSLSDYRTGLIARIAA